MNLGMNPSSFGSVQSSTAPSFSRSPGGSPTSVLRRAGLDPGVVDEELLVQRDEVFPLIRCLVLNEDRGHRADRLAGPAVDALVGEDVGVAGPGDDLLEEVPHNVVGRQVLAVQGAYETVLVLEAEDPAFHQGVSRESRYGPMVLSKPLARQPAVPLVRNR